MKYMMETLPCMYCGSVDRSNVKCACTTMVQESEDIMVEYPSSDDITFTSCFINPYGVFYPVPYGSHSYFARGYSMNNTDPVGDLESRGWVHISEEDGYVGVFTGSNVLMGGGVVRNTGHITSGQADVLFTMLMKAPKGARLRFITSVRKYMSDFGEM